MKTLLLGVAFLCGSLVIGYAVLNSTQTSVNRVVNQEMDGRHHVTKVMENGKLVRKDFYGDYGGVEVTYFDGNGKPVLSQTWFRHVKHDPQKKEEFVFEYSLMRVSEYYPNTDVKKNSFTMSGGKLWDITEFDAKGNVTASRRYYGPDGTLSEVDLYDATGNIVKSEKHTASEGLRATVDPKLLIKPDNLRQSE